MGTPESLARFMRSIEELYARRTWCQFCKSIVDTADGDPRKADAMEHLNKQLVSIDAQITEITGTPPPVVVQLKTAKLLSKSKLGE